MHVQPRTVAYSCLTHCLLIAYSLLTHCLLSCLLIAYSVAYSVLAQPRSTVYKDELDNTFL
jgi:hypothetical protein